jgi:AcrR family transcriptional regulator
MSSEAVPRLDRRHARRAATIDQLIDVAVQVMAEYGVAGLSLGEVARRMGIRPPSLYVYFDSKHAVYDAVFARGWEDVARAMDSQLPDPEGHDDLRAYLLEFARAFVRWNVEHPVHAQLMSWRPVPGYEPSEQAYAPAVIAFRRGQDVLGRLQALGLLSSEIPLVELMQVWTVLISGAISQQLANAPDESFEEGAFTSLLPQLVAMYLALYSPPSM